MSEQAWCVTSFESASSFSRARWMSGAAFSISGNPAADFIKESSQAAAACNTSKGRDTCISHTCMHLTYIHASHIHTCISHTCMHLTYMHLTYMHTSHLHACISHTYMHLTYMHASHIHACISHTCISHMRMRRHRKQEEAHAYQIRRVGVHGCY